MDSETQQVTTRLCLSKNNFNLKKCKTGTDETKASEMTSGIKKSFFSAETQVFGHKPLFLTPSKENWFYIDQYLTDYWIISTELGMHGDLYVT